MKILNCYAGIGGNRKLWGNDHEITAIEYNQDIANIYQDFFPDDKVIVTDAHEYLLEHFKEFDFIWASPPCPTHSRLNTSIPKEGNNKYNKLKPKYPDMQLYQEIIFLKQFVLKNTKWIVENVIPYYEYLINPDVILQRHPFWCNFYIEYKDFERKVVISNIEDNSSVYGVTLSNYKIKGDKIKRKMLRNMVNPELGLYILNQALNIKDEKQMSLFEGLENE